MKILQKKVFFTAIISIAMLLGGWTWMQYQDVQGTGLPVLLYHGVDSHGPKNKYTLDTEVFEQQLQWLHNDGYVTILPGEIKGRVFQENPEKKVMLTFDDGLLDNFQIVFPLLQKYGFDGLFFIITDEIGKGGRIHAEQLREMSDRGCEIGSHTISHPYLDALSDTEIVHQLKKSKQVLEKITGKEVAALAPPGGWFNKTTVYLAQQEGYSSIFSCEIGLNDLTENPFVYKRIEVVRGMSLSEFKDLLVPARAFGYKFSQSLKFFLHDLIGTANYQKLSHAFQ